MAQRSYFCRLVSALLACMATMATIGSAAQKVIRLDEEPQPLAERWQSALAEAGDLGEPAWVGFCFPRSMMENEYVVIQRRERRSMVGTITDGSSSWHRGKPLVALLGSDLPAAAELSDDEKIRAHAESARARLADSGYEPQKVAKKVAVLLFVDPHGATFPSATQLKVANITLPIELDDHPLIWLGHANPEESVSLLQTVFTDRQAKKLQRDLITTIGWHETSAASLEFLLRILGSSQDDRLREAAVYGLGRRHEWPKLVELMIETAKNDRSIKVRKAAIHALGESKQPAATEALINLITTLSARDLRKETVYYLQKKGNAKSSAALAELVYKDGDRQIQKEALYSLANLAPRQGIEKIIEVATKHNEAAIRKEAVYYLRKSDQSAAWLAIQEIVYRDNSISVQKAALHALSKSSNNLPRLIAIAMDHPNRSIRKEAVFYLAKSRDPRALAAIEKLAAELS